MLLLTRLEQARVFPQRRDGTMRKRMGFGPDRAQQLNPFLSLMEDWMRAPGGYIAHVHRGYETVSLVLEGQMVFADTGGQRALLSAGDVQWTTTGEGLTHSELPVGEAETHLIQLWLNLPSAEKHCAPRTQDLLAATVPQIEAAGVRLRVISGELNGVRGPAATVHPVRCLEARLEAGRALELPVPAGQLGFLYVIAGEVTAGPQRARSGELVHFTAKTSDALPITASEAAHFLVLSAPPLHEPVQVSGPFIMNTKAELKSAYDDFKAGSFELQPLAR